MVLIPLVVIIISTPSPHGEYPILIVASFLNLIFAVFFNKTKKTIIQRVLIFSALKALTYWGNVLFVIIGWDRLQWSIHFNHSKGFELPMGIGLLITALLGMPFVWLSSLERKEIDQVIFSQEKIPEELAKQASQYQTVGKYIWYFQLCLMTLLLIPFLKHTSVGDNDELVILMAFVLMPIMWLGTSIRKNCENLYKKCMEATGTLPDTKETWLSKYEKLMSSQTGLLISISLVLAFFIFKALF